MLPDDELNRQSQVRVFNSRVVNQIGQFEIVGDRQNFGVSIQTLHRAYHLTLLDVPLQVHLQLPVT